jgi:hypothetical protein
MNETSHSHTMSYTWIHRSQSVTICCGTCTHFCILLRKGDKHYNRPIAWLVLGIGSGVLNQNSYVPLVEIWGSPPNVQLRYTKLELAWHTNTHGSNTSILLSRAWWLLALVGQAPPLYGLRELYTHLSVPQTAHNHALCWLPHFPLSAQSCRNRGQGGGRHWVSNFIPLGVPFRSLTLDPTTAGSDSFTLTYVTTSMILLLLVGPNSVNLSDSHSRNDHNVTSLVDTLTIKSTLKDLTLFGHAAYVIFYVSWQEVHHDAHFQDWGYPSSLKWITVKNAHRYHFHC